MTGETKPLPEKYRLARNIKTGMEVLDTGANEWVRVTRSLTILAPMKVTVLDLPDGGWSGPPDARIMSRRVVDQEGTDKPWTDEVERDDLAGTPAEDYSTWRKVPKPGGGSGLQRVDSPAGSVPLPTPSEIREAAESREALRDRMASAIAKVVGFDFDDAEATDQDQARQVADAVLPIVEGRISALEAKVLRRKDALATMTAYAEERHAKVLELRKEAIRNGQRATDEFNRAESSFQELATTREERDEAKRNYDDQMRLRMEVEKVLDFALGCEDDDGAGMGLVGDVALLADRLKAAQEELAKWPGIHETTQRALIAMEKQRDSWKAALGVDHGDIDTTPEEARAALAPVSPAVPEDPATPTPEKSELDTAIGGAADREYFAGLRKRIQDRKQS